MFAKNGTIFINYRRDDSNWNALALYNELQKYFSQEQLFKDFNAIAPGDDFAVSIHTALNNCNVLLVIIGKEWLGMKNPDGTRRLDDPNDFVRLEVATSLEREIKVVPVLFDGAPMPKPEELPDNLKALCRRQFIEIDPKGFEDDVRRLAEAIKKILPAPAITPVNHTSQQTVYQAKTPVQENQSNVPPVKPDNFLIWAILSTLLCCLPLGIVSIVHSTKVDGLYANKQYKEANEAAEKAKQWAIYSAVGGIIVILLVLANGGLQ